MPRAAIAGLLAVALAAAPAAGDPGTREAAVTYVTTSTAYVDAGAGAGLRPGDFLEVRREGRLLTWLEVTAVSSKRASCRRVEPDVVVSVGDRVHYRPGVVSSPTGAGVTEATPPASAGTPRRRRAADRALRGRIELRYLGLVDGSELDRGYSEPGVGLRLDGALGHDVRVSVDARARRTYRPDEEEGRSRVYRLLAEWGRPAAGRHVALGRQVSAAVASIGVFDGVLAEWRNETWGGGAFSGFQPEPASFGTSSEIREHGLWVERGGRTGASGLWRLTLAAVGSYAGGTIDREYLALQGRLTGTRLEGYALQELDLARGWKADAGEDALMFTSSLVNARWRFSERWSISAGSDTRRNVRLYRDRVTPETEFDDDYRTGHWGGIDFRPTRRTSLGANARRSGGGSGGTADSYTLRGGAGTSRLRNLDLRTRTTRYVSDRVEGWLLSGDLSLDVTSRVRAGTSIGRRRERTLATGTEDEVTWVSGDTDVYLRGGWLILASVERSHGGTERTTQIHASLGWRF